MCVIVIYIHVFWNEDEKLWTVQDEALYVVLGSLLVNMWR